VVDASARQLLASGFVHNRARMISASFLTKHLCISYRRGEAHYMKWLTDGDWAQNDMGWQWSSGSGCDAQPWFRIFDPVAQGERHDASGAYVFNNLPPRRAYSVCEVVPTPLPADNFNWLACFPADGHSGAALTSAACLGQNPAGGTEWYHNPFLLVDNVQKDFRNYQQPIITRLSGVAFCDVNGNGALNDPDDVGVSGFCVESSTARLANPSLLCCAVG
jgi:hypothetical protein